MKVLSKLSDEELRLLSEICFLTDDEVAHFRETGSLTFLRFKRDVRSIIEGRGLGTELPEMTPPEAKFTEKKEQPGNSDGTAERELFVEAHYNHRKPTPVAEASRKPTQPKRPQRPHLEELLRAAFLAGRCTSAKWEDFLSEVNELKDFRP